MKNLNIKKLLYFSTLFSIALLIILSSAVSLYSERERILTKVGININSDDKKNAVSEADAYWAKEILNGGYILHFRHAERDKWIDVQKYDALESDLHDNGIDESRYAENDYFAQAVCLNSRGKIQARAMGEHIAHIGLPISYVVSSVSCRARQTAELAFGGYETQNRLLVHAGPYNEGNEDRTKKLKEFYSSLPVSSEGNVIVSAHNSVVKDNMFENSVSDLYLEEGGFYVISLRDGKLYLEHEFHYFKDFMRIFYVR